MRGLVDLEFYKYMTLRSGQSIQNIDMGMKGEVDMSNKIMKVEVDF